MASTAIKLAGGVSAKDAWTLSRDMRCEPDFLLAMHKHQGSTDFACFIRNVTPQPVALTVPFGQMEGRPRMSEDEYEALLAVNRRRVAEAQSEVSMGLQATTPPDVEDGLPAPELL